MGDSREHEGVERATKRRAKALTDRRVATLKPQADRRAEYFDGDVPGLACRVNAGGRKSWVLYYRVGRRQRRWTLGTYPVLSLAAARKKARRALTALSEDGIDPATAKRTTRTEATFADLAAAYVQQAKLKKRSWASDARMLRTVLLPAWRHRAVTAITRQDVKALLAVVVAKPAPVAANRLAALISTIFNFAIKDEWMATANPAARIDKQPETSRDRVLSDDELRTLWAVLETATVPRRVTDDTPRPPIAPMIARGLQVVLLTAQRSGEVFTMRWQDVDLDTGWWTIPTAAAKNKSAHRVPLAPRVVELLADAKANGPAENPWVFGGDKGGSVAARAVKAMAALRRTGAIDFDCHRHDLRRTAATRMAQAGVPRETLSRVLNHIDRGSRMTKVYDRYDYDAEKRTALEAWARRLDAILTATEPARVVPFARA